MPSDMSASLPAAFRRGPATKPKSKAVARCASRPATANSASTPGCARPARMRARPCSTKIRFTWSRRTTSATVPSATRSTKAARFGSSRPVNAPCAPQQRARRKQHVEHDADAGDVLARESAAGLIRIHDDRGRGQHRARQMVVRDQHIDASCGRGFDAIHARDAVVDGDQKPRLHSRGERHDFRREPVAEFEPVGNDEIDVGAHHSQAPHADGAGRRAVRVVVGDDDDRLLRANRTRQALRRRGDAPQPIRRRQRREAMVQLGRRRDAARRVDARQDAGHSRGSQQLRGRRDVAAGNADRHASSSSRCGGMKDRAAYFADVRIRHPGRDACHAAAMP